MITTGKEVKPSIFFYVVAILSTLMACWLFFRSVVPHLQQFFVVIGFSPSVFYIITNWLEPLAQLSFIAGGILSFFRPKFSWYLFVGASACSAFLLWHFARNLLRTWFAIFLLPLPGEESVMGALFIDLSFMVLQSLSLFYFFFCRAGREIKWRNKIIYIGVFILIFAILYFMSPQFKYGEVGGWGGSRY